ncbi:TEL2, telomere maintenance protein 2 [Thoreauomyces humboldtii]|nr:TEL2, telomere maintenance protein 2 [Thoreauomyces humboldtii]
MAQSDTVSNGNEGDPRQLLAGAMTRLHAELSAARDSETVKLLLAEPLSYFLGSPNVGSYLPNPSWGASSRFAQLGPNTLVYGRLFKRHFLVSHYEFLLKHIAADWLTFFTNAERTHLFDEYFVPYRGPKANAPDVLLSSLSFLVGAVAWTTHTIVLQNVARLLQLLLTKYQVKDFQACAHEMASSVVEGTSNWQEFVTLVCSLPDRMANSLRGKAPPFFVAGTMMTMIGREISSSVENLANVEGDDALRFGNQLASLIGRIVRLGHVDSLIDAWLPTILDSRVGSLGSWTGIWGHLSGSEFQQIFSSGLRFTASVVPCAAASQALLSWVGQNTIEESQSMESLIHKLLFESALDASLLRVLVLIMSSYPAESPLSISSQITTLIETWGDPAFIKHASQEQHRHITSLILLCLSEMKSGDASSTSLVATFLQNMHPYLDSADLRVRRMGMVTAECFSRKFSPGTHLNFELVEDEETVFLRSLASSNLSTLDLDLDSFNKSVINKVSHSTGLDTEEPSSDQDPDEIEVPEAEIVGDSDDDLEPYDMPDIAVGGDDEKPRPRAPMYIQECLEGLESHDDPDKLQVCLESVSSLVASAPLIALDEYRDKLCSALIYLQDTYDLPGFAEQRMSGLTAIVIAKPLAAKFIASKLYTRHISFRQRMDILSCMGKAALELSAASFRQSAVDSAGSAQGLTKRTPRPQPRANSFAPHATSFLLALLGGFEAASFASTIFAGAPGRILLGKLITTAGIFVHAAGNSIETRQLARQYFDFIWTLRLLDVADTQGSLRQPILFGISVIFTVLPNFLLQDEFGQASGSGGASELTTVQMWLIDVLATEPKPSIRDLAVSILRRSEQLYQERSSWLALEDG